MTVWVAVIVGFACLTVCVVAIVWFALRYLQIASEMSLRFLDAHNRTLNALERTHARNVSQVNGVLDRFMALDFSVFKNFQLAEAADVGGFETPEEQEVTGTITFNQGGRMVRPGAVTEEMERITQEESELLAEDFGPEFERKEGLR